MDGGKKEDSGIKIPGMQLENYTYLLNDQLSREFLANYQDTESMSFPQCRESRNYYWLKVERLPVSPGNEDHYNLLERWQGGLSAMHTLGSRVALSLVRNQKTTSIYLGACKEGKQGGQVSRKLSQAARIHMPGLQLSAPLPGGPGNPVVQAAGSMPYTGIVTGLPSKRTNDRDVNLLQTLDKLAYGISDENGYEEGNYSLLVLAEPAEDREISSLIQTLTELKGEIHKYIRKNISESSSNGVNDGSNMSVDVGSVINLLCVAGGMIAGTCTLGPVGTVAGASAGKDIGKMIGDYFGLGMSRHHGTMHSESRSVSHEECDFTISYCEQLIDRYIRRLQQGRSMGFWNAGVYVLGDSPDTVDAVLGILRSVYSGMDSYVEPIRTFNTGRNLGIHSYMENFCLLPLPVKDSLIQGMKESFGLKEHWHVFGPLYEYFSTPLNTEELSIAASLPRQDVPGLRVVHNAVKLTANPPRLPEGCRKLYMGQIYDMGMPTGQKYYLNADALVRHVLNDGITGYGKSTTTLRILSGLGDLDIPWLVIEPVKTDYVEWAMEYNETCLPQDRIAIYMPGYDTFYGRKLEKLRLNPFQPCAPEGVPLNIQGHLDALSSLLTSSISMGEVLPLLMKEALQNLADYALGTDYRDGSFIAASNQADPKIIQGYPKFSGLLKSVHSIMDKRGYASENHQNLSAAMETRIQSLLAGWKKEFFDTPWSTPGKEMFGRKVIINLIGIESDEDKAFFMSLILRALNEYRSSSYYYLEDYRRELADGDRLMHFTVVEEAHRLLAEPMFAMAGEANPQGAAATMFSNMLREIRKWGEGLMIVDQQPSKLIPDAIKNTDLKIIHRMPSMDDRRAVGSCMGLNEVQTELIAALDKGEAIIHSAHDDAAMWVKVARNAQGVQHG